MQTKETKRDSWISAGLVVAAVLAGLAALAAQRGGAGVLPPAPAPAVANAAPAPLPKPAPVESAAPDPAPKAAKARPRVDMVFALDTTGSMSGLLEGAKRKIWSMASFVAHGQPAPELRVGLVAYRDTGDAYVTRVYDLDADLDRVYRRILGFHADGGGDGPEHVARALHEAVHKMSWSKGNNDGAVRLLYLVGDAPPHVDYNDGFDYAKAARDAAQRGIQVHAIRCGGDQETARYWRRIASLGHGEFLTIDQDGGMRDKATPYDDELAHLHDRLSDTVIPYGHAAADTRAALGAAEAAPAPVKAARASYLAAKKEVADDLVESVASGKVDVARAPAASLPPEIAAAPPAEREKKIAEKAKTRREVMERIGKVSKERDAYLSGRKDDKRGFDDRVEETVRAAGAKAGLAF